MGLEKVLWLNHFFSHGQSPKEENPLTLGFSKLGGSDKERRKETIIAPIKVPTRPIPEAEVEGIKQKLIENGLGDFPLREKPRFTSRGYPYVTLEITLPNKRILLHKLPQVFQAGDYGKRFRFDFFPEQLFPSPDAAQEVLKDEHKSYEPRFLTQEEFASLPYVVLDIEKPLWKKEHEKDWIKRRKKWTKKLKKAKDSKRQERINKVISGLEKKLTTTIEGVGEAKLYSEEMQADVSFATVLWGDGKGGKEKEIYLLDPRSECTKTEHNGYRLRTFTTERDLVSALNEQFHVRQPVISSGHNQVYDYTQLRFAAEAYKDTFDPAVEGQKPRRDFVRSFLQRLRQDLIYIDTMLLAQLFFPYLRQKSFGTSLRLEPVAQFLEINFKKSLSHEELREVEARRLLGETPEIRKEALEKLLTYSSKDIEVTHEIKEKIPFIPLLAWMKKVFPFSTYSKLAFSANAASEVHDFKYYQKRGCLPYFGFHAKERIDETMFIAKTVERAKKEALLKNRLTKARSGEYTSVSEYYLPLEDWLFKYAVMIAGKDLASAKVALTGDQRTRLAFLQYVKAVLKDPLMDFFLTQRYAENAQAARDFLSPKGFLPFKRASEKEQSIEPKTLDELCRQYRAIEKGWFSLEPTLGREKKSLIASREPASWCGESVCPDLSAFFLMQQNERGLREGLSTSSNRDFSRTINGFNKFLEAAASNGIELNKTYIATQEHLHDWAKKRFYAKYGFECDQFDQDFHSYYTALAEEIRKHGTTFLEARGDYIFVQDCQNQEMRHAIKVRSLEAHIIGKKKE